MCPTKSADTKIESRTLISIYLNKHKKALSDAIPGDYVTLPVASVDGLAVSIQWFPAGHEMSSADKTVLRGKCSLGISIANKLDVHSRLRRRGKDSKLMLNVNLGSGTITCDPEFKLRDFVQQDCVFTELNFTTDTFCTRFKKLELKLHIVYSHPWEPEPDLFDLRKFKMSIKHGDVNLYVLECEDLPIPKGEKQPVPLIRRLDDENTNTANMSNIENADKVKFTVEVDKSVRIGKVELMATNQYFERILASPNPPTEIGLSAPSLLQLECLVFYATVGEVHHLAHLKWFLELAHFMKDDRLLKRVANLCVKRLHIGNVIEVAQLFEGKDVGFSQGIEELINWITSNRSVLKKTNKSVTSDSDKPHVKIYDALKKILFRYPL